MSLLVCSNAVVPQIFTQQMYLFLVREQKLFKALFLQGGLSTLRMIQQNLIMCLSLPLIISNFKFLLYTKHMFEVNSGTYLN